jgi:uncharacterized protein (DUF362 family)/NAD-dependent dihydropyrimidine dehydrogenase PreA subunit
MPDVFLRKFSSYTPELEPFFNGFFQLYSSRLLKCRKILLKPNLLQAATSERAVTTHPEFLTYLVRSLKRFTRAELILADSPGANFNNFSNVLKITGIQNVCDKENITVARMESFQPIEKDDFVYSGIADEVDMIINIAKLKTHSLTGLTMCVKNFFGLVPGTAKVAYHRRYPSGNDLGDKLYSLSALFADKSLNFLDGIIAHEGEGPSRGKPVNLGIVAASENAAALDIEITKLLGLPVNFCTTNAEAMKFLDVEEIKLNTGACFDGLSIKTPVSMKKSIIPESIKKIVADKIYVKPEIIQPKCTKCLLCLKSCYADAITFENKTVFINKELCKECFCCYEVCEDDAIKLKRSFLHRIFVK